MSTSEIYHHHGIKDYKYVSMNFENGTTIYKLIKGIAVQNVIHKILL